MMDDKAKELEKHLRAIAEAHIGPAQSRAMATMNLITSDINSRDSFLACMEILRTSTVKPLITLDLFCKLMGRPRQVRHALLRAAVEALVKDAILTSDMRHDEQGNELRPDGTREVDRGK